MRILFLATSSVKLLQRLHALLGLPTLLQCIALDLVDFVHQQLAIIVSHNRLGIDHRIGIASGHQTSLRIVQPLFNVLLQLIGGNDARHEAKPVSLLHRHGIVEVEQLGRQGSAKDCREGECRASFGRLAERGEGTIESGSIRCDDSIVQRQRGEHDANTGAVDNAYQRFGKVDEGRDEGLTQVARRLSSLIGVAIEFSGGMDKVLCKGKERV